VDCLWFWMPCRTTNRLAAKQFCCSQPVTPAESNNFTVKHSVQISDSVAVISSCRSPLFPAGTQVVINTLKKTTIAVTYTHDETDWLKPVTLVIYFREVSGLNLGLNTGCPHWCLSSFSSVLAWICRTILSPTSFHMFPIRYALIIQSFGDMQSQLLRAFLNKQICIIIKQRDMKTSEGVEVQLCFLTLTLDGDKRSVARPGRFIPGTMW
jgi:hypothetical protein